MENLDFICIKHGQQMPRDKDSNVIRKALGLLEEDGVYAMFLWLEIKDREIIEKLIPLLNESGIRKNLLKDHDNFSADFKVLTEKLRYVAEDVDKLLLLKKTLERTLTYALYHSRIKSGAENVEKA